MSAAGGAGFGGMLSPGIPRLVFFLISVYVGVFVLHRPLETALLLALTMRLGMVMGRAERDLEIVGAAGTMGVDRAAPPAPLQAAVQRAPAATARCRETRVAALSGHQGDPLGLRGYRYIPSVHMGHLSL